MNTRTKATTLLAAASFTLTGVIAVMAGRAAADDGFGLWQGTGTAYDAQGAKLGTYALAFTRRQAGANVRIDGKATLASGQELAFWEEDESDGSSGYRIRSSNGAGHGGCFANEVCQTYRQGPNGRALATTIVVDSPDTVRLTETELDQQQVVQYREATLKRTP